jgi:hypothetical protein
MAAASLQLISVFQGSLTETPASQGNVNTTPLNPNQAQGAAMPQDTVTLSGQTALGQQTGQSPQQRAQFQEKVITLAGAQISAPTNPGAQQVPAAQPLPAAQQLAAAVAGAPTAATNAAKMVAAATNAGTNNATNNGGPQTPQQQLQQLDEALQQLGINPESISLSSRMAMLLYADDPAALQSFVQQAQQVAQQSGQLAATGATANNPGAAAAPQQQEQPAAPPQQQTQPPDAANPTIPASSPLNQDTGTNQTLGNGSNRTLGNGSTASGNNVFVQFEELQVAFATVGQDQTQDQTPAQGALSVPQRQVLSVTA